MRSQPVWVVGCGVGDVLVAFRVVGQAKTRENSDFAAKINEINLELSGNLQRYVNECCESESDGKIDGFGAGCCKCRGGVAVAICVLVLIGNEFYKENAGCSM
jgi:hypothetical protein